jgi:ribosomal-protein-alanine N-acetyltransferase
MKLDAQLSLIILAVRDLPRALDFYRRCFEWPLVVDAPLYKEFRMPSGQRLGLYFHEGFGRNTGQPATLVPADAIGATELYFHVADAAPLTARLLAAGARLLSPMSRRPWNEDAAYFADLDGNVLVVAIAVSEAPPRKEVGVELRLSRCTVRDWRRSDRESLARYANNPAVADNLRDRFPHPYTLDDAEGFLSFALRMSPRTYFAIAVDDEAAGGIGLTLHDDVERVSAELGYWLGEPFWGRGIMTEAVVALTEWAWRTLPLTRIYAVPFGGNLSSVRVLEKAGYTFEGRLRRNVIKHGEVRDQLMYACIKT